MTFKKLITNRSFINNVWTSKGVEGRGDRTLALVLNKGRQSEKVIHIRDVIYGQAVNLCDMCGIFFTQ